MLKHVSRHFLSPCFGKAKACCRLISIVQLETGEKNHPHSYNSFPLLFPSLLLKFIQRIPQNLLNRNFDTTF